MALKTSSWVWSTEKVVVKFRLVMIVPLSECVWLSFTRGDQLAQIAVNERAPCVRAATVAFILGYQAYVCKTDLRFARLFRDIKNNVRATPLAFVFYEVKIAGLTRAKRLFCQEQIL